MATSAINNGEFHKGFTSAQWAYGRQVEYGEEELRRQICLPVAHQQREFLRLLNNDKWQKIAREKQKLRSSTPS